MESYQAEIKAEREKTRDTAEVLLKNKMDDYRVYHSIYFEQKHGAIGSTMFVWIANICLPILTAMFYLSDKFDYTGFITIALFLSLAYVGYFLELKKIKFTKSKLNQLKMELEQIGMRVCVEFKPLPLNLWVAGDKN